MPVRCRRFIPRPNEPYEASDGEIILVNHLRLLAHFYILDFLVLACFKLLILVFFIFDIDTAKMRRAIESNKSQGTHGKIVGNL